MFLPNVIKADLGDISTDEIKILVGKYTKVLLIVLEKDNTKYLANSEEEERKSYYSLLKTTIPDKFTTTFSKFFYLALQGYISCGMWDCVIIRGDTLKKEFATAFKHFYFGIQASQRPQIVAYLSDPATSDSIYLKAIQNREQPSSNISLIYVSPLFMPEINEFIRLKILLQNTAQNYPFRKDYLEKIANLEKISFCLALNLLKELLEPIRQSSVYFEEKLESNQISNLLINEWKFRRLRSYLQDGLVLLYTKEPSIFNLGISPNLLNLNSIDEKFLSNNAKACILIVYDEGLIPQNLAQFGHLFKEIVVLVGEGHQARALYNTIIFQELASSHFKKSCLSDTKKLIPDKSNDIITSISMSNEANKTLTYYTRDELAAHLKFLLKDPKDFIVPTSNALICYNFSFQLLCHFIYLVEKLFQDHFLFMKNIKTTKKFSQSPEHEFYCILTLPVICNHDVFTKEQISNPMLTKKEAVSDVSFQIPKELHGHGLCDDNLFPVKKAFIDNNKVYQNHIRTIYKTDDHSSDNLKKIYENFLSQQRGNNLNDPEILFQKFMKENRIFYGEQLEEYIDIDKVYRKQPACLQSYPSVFSVYSFSAEGTKIGILAGESFKETVVLNGVTVKFLGQYEPSADDLEEIVFYQVVFFGMNFRRINPLLRNTRKYCYFVVPICSDGIDFNTINSISRSFLQSSVYEVQDKQLLQENVLFDPFTVNYHTYHSPSNRSLLDNLDEAEGISTGNTYCSYFENKYNIRLMNKSRDTALMFKGIIFQKQKTTTVPSLMSSEIIQVTSVKQTIYQDYRDFVEYFNIFETIALAYELQLVLDSRISLQNLLIATTLKNSFSALPNQSHYDRYEFLGDTVLKLTTSKHLLSFFNISLGEIVTTKDSLIGNENLRHKYFDLGIDKYIGSLPYSEAMFQPPDITLIPQAKASSIPIQEYISHFRCDKVFSNNNQYYHLHCHQNKMTGDQNHLINKKTHADIIEALIGAAFLDHGLNHAMDFIKWLGIFKTRAEEGPKFEIIYENGLKHSEISMIEALIDYKFRNPGLLEKAIYHPSYACNCFGSEIFQKLELIGDSLLDLMVTNFIFFEYPTYNVSQLHDKRKSLVNNITFSRVLFASGLAAFCRTGFKTEDLHKFERSANQEEGNISKAFSDILEAIAGAVALDCDFNLQESTRFFNALFRFIIQKSISC